MRHFPAKFFKGAQGALRPFEAIINGFASKAEPRITAPPGAICYSLKPGFIRTFATSGYPFMTYYEFNDLAGWCRDTYFAPDHVAGYAEEIGKAYTVWTHEELSAYRRHVILGDLRGNLTIAFEVPFLTAAAWFPLRITLFDVKGVYFQTDQKLVVERIDAQGAVLSSWKKIPALRDSLPRLRDRTAR
ncbi:hypothetical protein [Paenirhodobacter sp. CAU 1674]|uniref:hypothetical protein n=1 Tax=Paenirhodobacter sp. CAU 1674 TaxID=3032596 RepID=UPI0023DA61F3|nr:hypothetical protein [Paenirhodobacter sp. CAU 1674]MDF2142921.1 hypothetical protein [Paenirhodobacter sp. CAU 1674]